MDKVTQMLNEINWNARIPYIQSLELSINTLMCYIQFEDYKEGLNLSILSKELGSISSIYPGAKKSQDIYEIYIQIGELLSGNMDNIIIDSLEDKFKQSSIFVKPLIAYCLSKVYIKMNMMVKANEKIEYCKQAVPYCKSLIVDL